MNAALAEKASKASVEALTTTVNGLLDKDTIVRDKPQSGSNYTNGLPNIAVAEIKPNCDYLIADDEGKYFYRRYINNQWELISGAGESGSGTSSGLIVNSLPNAADADENTDYFVGTQSGGYIHYRFIKDNNNVLKPAIISNYANHDNIKTYNIRVGKENSNDGEVNYLYLYDFDYGESNEVDDDTNYDNLHLVNKV
jgi:hypothetical protein